MLAIGDWNQTLSFYQLSGKQVCKLNFLFQELACVFFLSTEHIQDEEFYKALRIRTVKNPLVQFKRYPFMYMNYPFTHTTFYVYTDVSTVHICPFLN